MHARLSLVWSGTDRGPSLARYTRIVVSDLFARASRFVTLAGYSFDHGERIFEPLHRFMCDRKVADHEETLITSANFTERGQSRNIEVGVLVRDTLFAQAIEQQWFNLVSTDAVVRWGG